MASKNAKEIVKLKKLQARIKKIEASIAQIIEDLGTTETPGSASVEGGESKDAAAIRRLISKCKPELQVYLLDAIKSKVAEYRSLGLIEPEKTK